MGVCRQFKIVFVDDLFSVRGQRSLWLYREIKSVIGLFYSVTILILAFIYLFDKNSTEKECESEMLERQYGKSEYKLSFKDMMKIYIIIGTVELVKNYIDLTSLCFRRMTYISVIL